MNLIALPNCQYCLKAKFLLEKNGYVYREIDMEQSPERLKDSQLLSGKTSVPQIFVGSHHVGGFEELEDQINQGIIDQLLADSQGKPVPHGLRPAEVSAGFSSAYQELNTDEVFQIGHLTYTFVEWAALLSSAYGSSLRPKDWLRFLKKQDNQTQHTTTSVEPPLRDFVLKGVLVPGRDGSYKISHTQVKKEYLLNSVYQSPDLSRHVHILELIKGLKLRLQSALNEARDPETLKVQYFHRGVLFNKFRAMSCDLQHVQVGNLRGSNIQAYKTFLINVYNILVIHAFFELGVPDNDLSRLTFFDSISYKFADVNLSASQIENGILRCNKAPPYQYKTMMDKNIGLVLPFGHFDHRIHFALNCGADSCPPVKLYSEGQLSMELELSARAFYESPSNFQVKEDTIWCSAIFKWYKDDFGGGDLLTFFQTNELTKNIPNVSAATKVKFLKYNWTTDSAGEWKYQKINPFKFFS